jgi:hypothetical protein
MTRRARFRAALALCGAVGAVWWWVAQRNPVLAGIEADSVRSVEVRFAPWGEEPPRAGGESNDPAAVAALVAVLRDCTSGTDHKCGSRGTLVLKRASGALVNVDFLPGHSAEWYELRYGGKLYRVPRAAFVEAVRRIGVVLPLEC